MHNIAPRKARRAPHAHMSPAEFMRLVAVWGGSLVLLSFISAAARYIG